MSDPDPCSIHVLSKEQIDILLKKKYDSVKRVEWRREYCQLLKFYLKICSTCQKLEMGDDHEEETLLEDLETFIYILKSEMIEIMSKSCEMKNAMTLMLCHHPRCINHTSWNIMDLSFMNWVCHRASEMGHAKLGISNKDCMKLGASSFEKLKSNVFNCLQPRLSNLTGEDDFLHNLNFAKRCYGIEYKIRELRHPSSGLTPPLCGEKEDDKHVFRRNLANALNIVISDWVEQEESKNNV